MKTLIKLPFKIVLLPIVAAVSVIALLAKVVVNTSIYIISPVIFICAGFSIYCAIQYGVLGFFIAISVAVTGFLILLAAFLAVEFMEGVNSHLIGILRS